MNYKQLLLGLSILVPAGAYGAAHPLFKEETIEFPGHICDYQREFIKKGIVYGSIIEPKMYLCRSLTYWWRNPGLVFVQFDTLQGPIFGFSGATIFYNHLNQFVEAYKDLYKNIYRQHPREYRVGGDYFNINTFQVEISP